MWDEAIGETKDDLLEIMKGIIDGAVDTLEREDVTDVLEIRSGKPGATSISIQALPTFEPQPQDSIVNQTLQIMFKG